jgi:predicted PilT family ATPase
MKNLERKGETLKITPLLGMYAIPAVHVCDLLVCVVEREIYDYKKQTMSTPVETGTWKTKTSRLCSLCNNKIQKIGTQTMPMQA